MRGLSNLLTFFVLSLINSVIQKYIHHETIKIIVTLKLQKSNGQLSFRENARDINKSKMSSFYLRFAIL